MAAFKSLSITKAFLGQIRQHQRRFSSAPVLLAAWNKDWKPGPYPKTPEERAAAAKKYGILEQDYEPYPDNGSGWGDYPMFKPVGNFRKSNYEAWDHPESKRNYGDLIHIDADIYVESMLDPQGGDYIPYWAGLSMFVLFIGGWLLIAYLVNPYPCGQKTLAKQYPFNDLWLQYGKDPSKEPTRKYYSFEPAE